MEIDRPVVVSIAGFDPTGGAGILADIKTFEQYKVSGFGVLSANTFQTDIDVQQVNWISLSEIEQQINLLIEHWDTEWFKIGIVESSRVLKQLVAFIIQKNPKAKFVWDPVLRSSSGFKFFESEHDITTLLHNISVLTPNLAEFDALIGSEENAISLSQNTIIYLKGGHRTGAGLGYDILYWKGGKYIFEPKLIGSAKHGSGCVLSSAICANLALGLPVPQALQNAKNYIEKFLTSNSSLLGWHLNL